MTQKDLLKELLDTFNNDKSAAIAAIKRFEVEARAPLHFNNGNTKIVISVSNLFKKYKLKNIETNVINNLSLKVHEGEFVAITGASGSGKSTLLHLLGGLDRPTSGSIEIDGQNIIDLNDRKLSKLRNSTIGFVFQFFYLQPFLSIAKNVEVPGMFARMPSRERKTLSLDIINAVGLGEYKNYHPKQLSGGQLQRAAISRALINNPKIILADEPTGNLDGTNSSAIIDILENLRRQYNVTIVLVTHDPNIASRADRVLVMQDGRFA